MVSAPIDRVRVYSQGATVTRTLTLTSPTPTQVEVAGLPLSLVDATVQVRSLAAEVVAGAVQIGLHAAGPEDLPETPDAVSLRRVTRRIEAIELEGELLAAEADLLRLIDVPIRPEGEEGKPPPPSPMRARVALEQFTDSAIDERLAQARAFRRELETLREEEAALRDAIRRASSAHRAQPHQLTKTLIVDLRGQAASVTLEIEYFVPGARWAPQYQCDIAPDGSGAAIKLRALVCQASGEDWRNVALELSTAAPRHFSELPTLASVRIGKAQPVPAVRGYRDPPRGSASLYADHDREQRRTQTLLPPRPSLSLPTLRISTLADIPAFDPPEMEASAPMRVGGSFGGASESMDMDDEIAVRMPAAGAAPSAPAPSPPPNVAVARSSPKKKARRRSTGERSKGAPNDKALRQEAAPEEAAAGRVAFARLRLGAPHTPRRGKLHVAAPFEDYRRLLSRSELQVDFDIAATVRRATAHATSAGQVAAPAGSIDVRSVAGHFDYAYCADDRVDLPSDLAFHSVPLGTRRAACRVTYVVVPRVDTNVFRIAAIDNPTHAPLLPGPTEVYVGGEYVLSTTLPTVAPKERFRLGLGVEQGIRCARNTRFREDRAGTNVVAMAELHHEIDVEIRNNLGRSIECEVRERIPQPDEDAEVDVEELSVKPPWEEWDQEHLGAKLEGGRRWRVAIEPQKAATVTAHYVVKIYANNEVVGGNRREA